MIEWTNAERESMAAAIYAADRNETFTEATRVFAKDRRSEAVYRRMADGVLEHFGYLAHGRKVSEEQLYHWLGAEAEAT